MIPWFELIDSVCKIVGALASIFTFILMWRHALPVIDKIRTETIEQTVKIEEIRDQTNGLSKKVETAAHVAGIVVGRTLAEQEIGTAAQTLTSIAASAAADLKAEADKVAEELKSVAADVRDSLKKE